MNEVLRNIKERRSVRKFKPVMPDKKLLDEIAEAGLWAASGKGRQATKTPRQGRRSPGQTARSEAGARGLIPSTARPSSSSSSSTSPASPGFTTAVW